MPRGHHHAVLAVRPDSLPRVVGVQDSTTPLACGGGSNCALATRRRRFLDLRDQREIRQREVLALAEQRFAELAGKRVDEAVPIVESGRVAPLPKVGKGLTRDSGLSQIKRHHVDAGRLNQ